MKSFAWILVAILAVGSSQTYGQDCIENDLVANFTAPLSDSLEPSDQFYDLDREQINLNQLVDFAVTQAIQTIKENHQETLPVPNIDERFKIGKGIFKIKGRFQASSGTFRDLTTIHRSSDVISSNNGFKYSVTCGFGIRQAQVKFDHYKLKAGVHVSGHISVEVHGIALEARVEVDYNQRPCVSTLQHVKVTHFGRPKVKISGLGPLNRLFSKLMSWVANHWRGKISHKIEDKLRQVAAQQLTKLKCEKYRPN